MTLTLSALLHLLTTPGALIGCVLMVCVWCGIDQVCNAMERQGPPEGKDRDDD